MRCLIVCHGYFGDHLFANSIAEHLITENQFDSVDYVVGFPQVIPFFERNPYVTNIICNDVGPSPRVSDEIIRTYDKVFTLKPITRTVAPAIELQLQCGVKNPSSKFNIITNFELDISIKEQLDDVRSNAGVVLAIMNNWEPKTFLFTKEQYNRGIDVPNLGYGGSHRNTNYIIDELQKYYATILVGAPANVTQFNTNYEENSLDFTASVIKNCDYFIGAEGGLANIAYAVGTKTILTSDFVHQLYGPNGVLQKLSDPQLGPKYYDAPENMHINLDPYLTDAEVITNIRSYINNL